MYSSGLEQVQPVKYSPLCHRLDGLYFDSTELYTSVYNCMRSTCQQCQEKPLWYELEVSGINMVLNQAHNKRDKTLKCYCQQGPHADGRA